MIVSSTEPRPMKALGKSSTLPERWGVDVLFPCNGGMVGVQRKTVSDLIASLQDGRLAKEVAQMRGLGRAVLMVEGRPKWSSEGVLLGRDYGVAWTRQTHRNLLMDIQANDIWVEQTDDTNDTVLAILALQEWLRKPKHHGLVRRPGPVSPWGKAVNRDWCRHILMGFEGIGPELADGILDHFGGRMPLTWRVTADELKQVRGVGPKRAASLIAALEGTA